MGATPSLHHHDPPLVRQKTKFKKHVGTERRRKRFSTLNYDITKGAHKLRAEVLAAILVHKVCFSFS